MVFHVLSLFDWLIFQPVAKDSAQPDSDPKRSKKADTSSVDVTTASEQ